MEENQQNAVNFQNVPPHDDTAEQAVLSSMFLDRDAVATALEILKADDFYRPDNRKVFEAAEELFLSGVPVDVVTIKSKLEEKQIFEQIGGLPFIIAISTAVGSSVNIRHYAHIVEEKSILRRLIKTAGEVSQISYEAKESVNEIVEKAEKGIFDIIQNRRTGEFSSVRDITVTAFEKIEEIYRNKGKVTGIATGFLDFDA